MPHRTGGVAFTKLGTMYKVLSENLSGHAQGDTVTADDLEGANIEALIEGGHITKATASKKKDEEA